MLTLCSQAGTRSCISQRGETEVPHSAFLASGSIIQDHTCRNTHRFTALIIPMMCGAFHETLFLVGYINNTVSIFVGSRLNIHLSLKRSPCIYDTSLLENLKMSPGTFFVYQGTAVSRPMHTRHCCLDGDDCI